MRLSITYPDPNSPDFLLFVLCVPYGSSSSTAGAAIIHSQQDVRAVHHPAIALHHAMGRIMIVQTNPLISAGQNILIFPLGRMRPALRLIRAPGCTAISLSAGYSPFCRSTSRAAQRSTPCAIPLIKVVTPFPRPEWQLSSQ